ncbi:unnamed protein product [Choristocarpus tenellus]
MGFLSKAALTILSTLVITIFVYSPADIQFGDLGFYVIAGLLLMTLTWTCNLVTAGVAAAVLLGAKTQDLEPLAVLVVSFYVSAVWATKVFSGPMDDVQVDIGPVEKEIRGILFAKDPGQLHRVDAWLNEYHGREELLLQRIIDKYQSPGKKERGLNGSSKRGLSSFAQHTQGQHQSRKADSSVARAARQEQERVQDNIRLRIAKLREARQNRG